MEIFGIDLAIDTEWFKHEGHLHRPGGSFACLTHTMGRKKDRLLDGAKESAAYLKTLKKRPSLLIAMQNAEYDIRQMKAFGLWPNQWEPRLWDTMLVEQALFGGWYQLNSLADLSRRWLDRWLDKDMGSQFSTRESLTQKMRNYADLDSQTTLDVAIAQFHYVSEQLDGEFDYYWNIDLPTMWAVLDMKPIRVDVEKWLNHSQALYAEGMRIQESLGFNVKSVLQVKAALKKVGISAYRSTDADTLNQFLEKAILKGNDKQINLLQGIIRSRKCRDAMSKYGLAWIENNVENDEWVYPNWNVTGAETGRMSCSKPNMQNIPKRGDGSIYRNFFLPSPGRRLLIGDVQQQEPRFSAFLSKDPKLTEEIINGVDLHQRAADLFNLRGRDARNRGKAINLGLNYGMSPRGLAARVGISLNDAEAGLRARRLHYARYNAWQDRQRQRVAKFNYVETVTGRRVWINPYSYQAFRNAINGPIQGSAADHTKLALSYIHDQCRASGIEFPVNLVVHDEIVMDVPKGMMKIYRNIMKNAWMEAGHKLMPTIPTVVDMRSGYTWGAEE